MKSCNLLLGLKDQIRLSLENDPTSSGNTSDAGSEDNNHTNPPPLSVSGIVAHEVSPASNKRKSRLAAAPPSSRELSPVKTVVPASGGGDGGGGVGRISKRKRDSSSSSSSGDSSTTARGCGGDVGNITNLRTSRSQVNGGELSLYSIFSSPFLPS